MSPVYKNINVSLSNNVFVEMKKFEIEQLDIKPFIPFTDNRVLRTLCVYL